MKLYIHIGAHKTGTTSFQHAMFSAQDDLLKEKILYPNCCIFQYAQHRLAFALKGMRDPVKGDVPDLEREVSELRRAVEKGGAKNSVVLSSEEFFTVPAPRVEDFVSLLRGFFSSIEIIATLRRQDNQFVSIYNQKVKGFGNGFYRHYSKFIDYPVSLDAELDYFKHLKSWDRKCDKMNLLVYEKLPDVSNEILALLGVRNVVSEGRRLNPSVSVPALELVRHLKARTDDVEKIKRYGRLAFGVFKPNPRDSLLTIQDRIDILSFFNDSNRRIENHFAVDLDFTTENVIEEHDGKVQRKIRIPDLISFLVNL